MVWIPSGKQLMLLALIRCFFHTDWAVRSWDEKQVISWLHTINCGQYEPLFKGNGMQSISH